MFDCLHDPCNDGQKQGDMQNQGQQNGKTREELVDDLADCLAQLRDDSDIEKINRILEEIEQLDPATEEFDVEESLAEFHKKYRYFFSAEPPVEKVQKPKRGKPLYYFARTAAIIAILLVICIGVAQAAGFNILNIFPWWNGEQFHFVREEDDTPAVRDSFSELEFESLQAALTKYGIQVPLAPTQLPDGAELQSLIVKDAEGQLMFSAKYQLPDGELFIAIEQSTGIPFSDVETDKDGIEVYTVNGIEHSIMNDMGMQEAVWHNGAWEGTITGDVSRKEITAMIDSIYQ